MKVYVFDFDGTLVNTPGREDAERLYLASTGNPWPFVGFYGRPESLAPPVFPEKPDESFLIQEVIDEYRKADGLKVLLTGRPHKMRHRIREICDHYNLPFDAYYLRGNPEFDNSGDTLTFKKSVLDKLLLGATALEMWEDREDHFVAFSDILREMGLKNPGVSLMLHRVFPAR